MSTQCGSQWQGHGCGRAAGHDGAHYSIDGMGGWCSGVSNEVIGPWEMCNETHPTAGTACHCVKGHDGPHYALVGAMPEGEPRGIKVRPHVAWSDR